MLKPEIARRCSVCGASIREAAFFCPQCGEELAQQDGEKKPTTSVITTPLTELSPAQDDTKPEGHRSQSEPERPGAREGAAKPSQRTPAGKASAGKAPVGKAPVGKVRNKI